jgi:glycosidase
MDAVPFLIEYTTPDDNSDGKDFGFLTDLRQCVQWQRQDALLLAEANVDPGQITKYFGDSGGSANRLHMLFDFLLNAQIMLALARQDPEPVIDALRDTPALPDWSQWATFLRNHDEVDLSRLTADQRQEVFAAFGPQEDMRLYGRGIRRRLAPMLSGDLRRIRLAYSLQFTLRGTPVIRYGEEIGMVVDRPDRGNLEMCPGTEMKASRCAGSTRQASSAGSWGGCLTGTHTSTGPSHGDRMGKEHLLTSELHQPDRFAFAEHLRPAAACVHVLVLPDPPHFTVPRLVYEAVVVDVWPAIGKRGR